MADGDGTQADAGNICQTNCEQVPAKIATGKANSVEYDDVARRQGGEWVQPAGGIPVPSVS